MCWCVVGQLVVYCIWCRWVRVLGFTWVGLGIFVVGLISCGFGRRVVGYVFFDVLAVFYVVCMLRYGVLVFLGLGFWVVVFVGLALE